MSAGTRAPDVGICGTCGKVRYVTRESARHAARIVGAKFGTRMRSYECEGYWHVTSMPAGAITALRSGDRDGQCALCGKPCYRCADEARAAAEAMTADGDGYWYAAECGESWHVRRFRWSGRYRKGAGKEHLERKREQAAERNARTGPGRRSTKKRAKRPKSKPAKEST